MNNRFFFFFGASCFVRPSESYPNGTPPANRNHRAFNRALESAIRTAIISRSNSANEAMMFMVESAPRLEALPTGETTRNANDAECLGHGDGPNRRLRQRNRGAEVTFWDGGSPSWTRFELRWSAHRRTLQRCSGGFNRLRQHE